jgi:hypothetical protein
MGVELLSGLLLLHAGDLGAEDYAPPPQSNQARMQRPI